MDTSTLTKRGWGTVAAGAIFGLIAKTIAGSFGLQWNLSWTIVAATVIVGAIQSFVGNAMEKSNTAPPPSGGVPAKDDKERSRARSREINLPPGVENVPDGEEVEPKSTPGRDLELKGKTQGK